MSIPGSASPLFLASTAAAGAYDIPRSIRFNPADSSYLNRTPSSASNRKTWTWSGWVKRSKISSRQYIFTSGLSSGSSESTYFRTGFASNDKFWVGSYNYNFRYTDMLFRDASAWYHIVTAFDSTKSTEADRCIIYVNGVQQSTTGSPNIVQNADYAINSTEMHKASGDSYFFDGYLADINFIDGQALAPTDFGEYDDNNVWQPKKFGGTYGTNGFKLDFSDTSSNSALGTDSSGAGNNWSVNNLAAGVVGFSNTIASSQTWSSYLTPSADGWQNNTRNAPKAFDSDLTTMAYINTGNASNYINFSYSTGISNHGGFIWLKGGNGNALGLTSMTVAINGSTATSTGRIGEENWNSWYRYPVSGALTSFRITGVYPALKAVSFWDGTPDTTAAGLAAFNLAGGTNNVKDGQSIVYGRTSVEGDALRDSPVNGDSANDTGAGGEITGNYCTLNPLAKGSGTTLSNGNLEAVAVSAWTWAKATIEVTSGKWYWEITKVNAGANNLFTGIAKTTFSNFAYDLNHSNSASYDLYGYTSYSGNKEGQGSSTSYGAIFQTAGDIIGVALDMDAGTITFYKNGASQGQAYSGITGQVSPVWGGTTSVSQAHMNFGQRSWAYAAPTNYKALCTANLSDPLIADGSTAFDAVLYSGTGNAQSITGLGFSPSLVWTKNRGASASHALYDNVRGAGELLRSNETTAEVNVSSRFTSFDSNGFSIGGTSIENNGSSNSYVSWAWDAGDNSNKTYAVTVSNPGSGNKYYVDGALQPTLTLAEGSTYKFDQSSGTNSTHPLRFSTTSDGTHGGGSEYTTGVTTSGTPGSAGAYTQIVIAASAPTLYAYCTAHSGMGFQINTSDTAGYTIPVGSVSSGVPSISSRIQANPSAGFSIVTWTGTANATVAHGLNAAPQLVLTKSSQYATAWRIWSASLSNLTDKYLGFDSAAEGTFGAYWGAMTSTTLGFPSVDLDNNYGAMVAYCFAPVEGYSAMGSYEGNGSDDGTFVYTGHRIAFLIIKRTDGADNWQVVDSARDPFNKVDNQLYVDLSNAEYSSNPRSIDFLSNGFKCRGNNDGINKSGGNYVYIAFAEHPFKTARAR